MLPRNMTFALYNDADDKGNPAPDTSQEKSNEDKGKTYTKAELDAELSRVGAKEKREAKAATEKAILESLGASNLDEIKAILEAKRKADESAKSAEEKLREELAQKDKELLEAKVAALNAEKLRLQEKRDNALKNLLALAHDPDGVLILLKAKYASRVDALLLENGDFDTKEAEKLVSEYKTSNAYQFKGDSKGSPSNADGRLLKPDSAIRDEVRKDIRNKFNF